MDWEDSCYKSGWHSADGYDNEPAFCETYGLIVKRSKRAITVAQSRAMDGDYTDAMTIPRSVILKIVYLQEKA